MYLVSTKQSEITSSKDIVGVEMISNVCNIMKKHDSTSKIIKLFMKSFIENLKDRIKNIIWYITLSSSRTISAYSKS